MKRRRRIDVLELAIAALLKKHIGGFFASLLAKAISKFASSLAQQLFEKWIPDNPDEPVDVDENEMMFI